MDEYLLIDLERTIRGGQVYYFKKNNFGYTVDYNESRLYTKEQADKEVAKDVNGRTATIRKSEVERILRGH